MTTVTPEIALGRFPEKHLLPFYERSNSMQTRRAYKRVVREFFRQFQWRHPKDITSELIRGWRDQQTAAKRKRTCRKLSSYARQNQTKKALWELENICRTLYILDFIDDVVLRQSVQKALNRGEAYHRFRRTIAYVNAGKFRVKTEAEQQLWNECSRLIANAVIYYNTLLLSRVYERKQADDDQEAMNILKGVSPIAWQHVNLFGTFEFNQAASEVDIDALAARYNDPVCWSKAWQEEADDR